MTITAELPGTLVRRLRATSTAGVAHRRWWDEQLRDVPDRAGPPVSGPEAPQVMTVALDPVTAERLDAVTGGVPARMLAVLTTIAGLATATPDDAAVLVHTPGPDGAQLPVRLVLRAGESRADLLSRALATVLAVLRAADGVPEDVVPAGAVQVAVLPAQDGGDAVPALVADWGGTVPALRVRAADAERCRDLADRVAALAAGLAGHPHQPVATLVRPVPDITAPAAAPAGADEPLSPLAVRLAAIWCDLLELDEVAPSDDFFELGGHSLLAVELVAEIRDHIAESATMSDIFAAPTLRDQADRLALLD